MSLFERLRADKGIGSRISLPDPPFPASWSFPDTKAENRCIRWPAN